MEELDNLAIAERIIIESGMSPIAFFYAGNGASYNDFIYNNTLTLTTIYNALLIKKKHNEFVKFVMSFDNLNAYDFITDFYFFARNNFTFEGISNLKRKYMIKEPDIYRAIKALLPDKEDETSKIKGSFRISIEPKRRVLARV